MSTESGTKQTQHFSDATFGVDVVNSDTPVLVDFWAPWCAPCRAIGPVVDELAADYAGRVKVGKLNIDENPETTGQYGIQSIPTLLVFKDGQVVGKIVGGVGKKELAAAIDKAL